MSRRKRPPPPQSLAAHGGKSVVIKGWVGWYRLPPLRVRRGVIIAEIRIERAIETFYTCICNILGQKICRRLIVKRVRRFVCCVHRLTGYAPGGTEDRVPSLEQMNLRRGTSSTRLRVAIVAVRVNVSDKHSRTCRLVYSSFVF